MQNAQSFNQMASDKRWVSLMGAIKGISQDLKTLAPHPNRQDHNGPLSVKNYPRAANDDGATLANMLIGAFCGAHFDMAAGSSLSIPEWASNIDPSNAIATYDAYQHDRSNTKTSGGESNRGIELGKNGTICGGFNMTARQAISQSKESMAWDAYLQDLPSRRILEKSISSMNNEAALLERQHMGLQQKMAYGM